MASVFDDLFDTPITKETSKGRISPPRKSEVGEVETTTLSKSVKVESVVPKEKIAPEGEAINEDENAEGLKHEEEKFLEGQVPQLKNLEGNEPIEYVICHVVDGVLTVDQAIEVQTYAEELNYPSGATAFGGSDDDFLYYCPSSREISVAHIIMNNIGYPKLEDELLN